MKNNEVIVSVCMITYNHEKYISEAIDGVLMQKTNFPIELIIGEDCSTDNTRKIVLEYTEKSPDIIRPLLSESNLGMTKNFIETMQAASGKYIALCEGDDYWTDPYKLQKQVDFLEENQNYSVCCHRYSIVKINSKKTPDHLDEFFIDYPNGFEYDLQQIMKYGILKTLTVVFRKDMIDISTLNRYKFARDVHLQYHLLNLNRKGYCLNFFGGIYNDHAGGVYSSTNTFVKHKLAYEIFRELALLNSRDIIVANMYSQVKKNLLIYFRRTIRHREQKMPSFYKDLILFVWNEFNENGLRSTIMVVSDIIKSTIKSFFHE